MIDTASDGAARPSTTSVFLPIATGRQTARELWRLLGSEPWRSSGTIAILVAASSAGLLVPALLGRLVDVVVVGGGYDQLLLIGGLLLGAAVLGAGLSWWGSVLLSRQAQRLVADLRERVVDVALKQQSSVIERAGTGDLVSRISSDVAAVTTVVGGVLPSAVAALFTIGLTLLGVGLIDWRFALAIVISAPIQFFALQWFLRRSAPVYRNERAAEALRGQQILESVSGADTVRALGRQDEHLSAIATASTTAIGFTIEAARIRTIFFGRLNIAEFIGLAAVLGTGFWLVNHDLVSLGAATAAALYFHNLFGPIGVALSSVDELQSAGASLARLVGVTRLERTANPTHTADQNPLDGRLRLASVGYAYESGRTVLHEVSLTIADGERIAVVGGSGAGKSTLVKLIAGILTPTSGDVQVGGVSLLSLTPEALRQHVVMVSQEVHVFVGTVRENLTLTSTGAGRSDDDLGAALRALGAEWALLLPDGLDTRIGDGGHGLDAAQSQHLALVRLALTDAPIAVLDEATAEAGSSDATALDRAAVAAVRGRTSIVVAHRLSQAVAADRILVMEAGRIVEEGSHAHLLTTGGQYADLWKAWSVGR
jgi:ATP-binding cassette subfamily C protein